jgi:hypothetical protein
METPHEVILVDSQRSTQRLGSLSISAQAWGPVAGSRVRWAGVYWRGRRAGAIRW